MTTKLTTGVGGRWNPDKLGDNFIWYDASDPSFYAADSSGRVSQTIDRSSLTLLQNFEPYSHDITQATGWSASNVTRTASQMLETVANSYHYVRSVQTVAATGTTFRYIGEFQAVNGRNVTLGENNNYIIVDLSNGNILQTVGTVSYSNVTSLGGGWYKITVEAQSQAVTNQMYCYIASGTTLSYAGDVTKGVNLRALQFQEARAVPTQLLTTSAAISVSGRQENLVQQSNDIFNFWHLNSSKGGFSGTTTDPFGVANNAPIWVEDGTLGEHYAASKTLFPIPYVKNVQYRLSVYIKNVVGTRNQGIRFPDGIRIVWDMSGGGCTFLSKVEGAGTIDSYSATSFGNGWYYIEMLFTFANTGGDSMYMHPYSGASASYTGDGVSSFAMFAPRIQRSTADPTFIPTFSCPTTSGTLIGTDTARPYITRSDRIENRLLYSNNLSGASWVPTNFTVNSATTGTFTAQYGTITQNVQMYAGFAYTCGFKCRRITGNTALWLTTNPIGSPAQTPITIDGTLKEYATTLVCSASGLIGIGISDPNAAGFGQIEITDFFVRQNTALSTYQATTTYPIYSGITAIKQPIIHYTGHEYQTDAVVYNCGTFTSNGTAGRNTINFGGATGKVWTALDFYKGGTEDSINCGSLGNFFDFTFCCWFNADGYGGGGLGRIFDVDTSNPYLCVNSTNPHLTFSDGSDTYNSPNNSITTGVWTHVVLIRKNRVGTLYLNGSPTTLTGTCSGSGIINLRIGNKIGGGNYFDGKIEDIRMYPYALEASDVAQIYNSGNGTLNEVVGDVTKSALLFDGSNDILSADALAPLLQGSDIPYSISVVVKNNALAASYAYCAFGNSAGTNPITYLYSSNVPNYGFYRRDDAAVTAAVNGGVADKNIHLITAVFYGTTASMWVDGVRVANNGACDVGFTTLNTLGIGAWKANTVIQNLPGYICEVVGVRRAITTDERYHLESYLANKWQIPTLSQQVKALGPTLWMQGRKGIVASGTTVTSWTDVMSGYGGIFTTRPTFADATITTNTFGKEYVRIPTNCQLIANKITGDVFSNNAKTFFIFVKCNVLQGSGTAGIAEDTDVYWAVLDSATLNKWRFLNYDGTNDYADSIVGRSTGEHVLMGLHSSGNIYIGIDWGALSAPTATGNTSAINRYIILGPASGTMQMDFIEYLTFRISLSTAQQDVVQSYLDWVKNTGG